MVDAGLERILGERLSPLDPAGTPWRRWEYKSFNRHAGLLQASIPGSSPPATSLQADVRKKVAASFRIRWLRGLAFGVLAEIDGAPPGADELVKVIDGRDNSRGVWQWVVVAASAPRTVVGVHTWMQVWLSPVFDSILEHYASLGYATTRAVREKDGLVRFLTGVAGLRGVRLPDYRPPT
jgi:hypothetical protein